MKRFTILVASFMMLCMSARAQYIDLYTLQMQMQSLQMQAAMQQMYNQAAQQSQQMMNSMMEAAANAAQNVQYDFSNVEAAPASTSTPSSTSLPSGTQSGEVCSLCNGDGHCTGYGNIAYISQYCRGTGRCNPCNGSGWLKNGFTGDPMRCTYCNNTGRCARCGGSGRCERCGGSGRR